MIVNHRKKISSVLLILKSLFSYEEKKAEPLIITTELTPGLFNILIVKTV